MVDGVGDGREYSEWFSSSVMMMRSGSCWIPGGRGEDGHWSWTWRWCGGGGGVVEGAQGDGVERHVVLLHQDGKIFPGNHLMFICELVNGYEFISWR